MNKTSHGVVQGLMTLLQILNVTAGVTSGKVQMYVATGAALIQSVLGVLNHSDTPTR